jgi:hypothetical protein
VPYRFLTFVHNFDDIYNILFMMYRFHSDLLKDSLMEINLKDTIEVYLLRTCNYF